MARQPKTKPTIIAVTLKSDPAYTVANANGKIDSLKIAGEITGYLELTDGGGNHLVLKPIVEDGKETGFYEVVDGAPEMMAKFMPKPQD